MKRRLIRAVEAVFSWVTVWTFIGLATGGVITLWWQWACPGTRVLPLIPAVATFATVMGAALVAEAQQRDRLRIPVPDGQDIHVVVPILCEYQGLVLGMHTWIATEPIATRDLPHVRLAVGMRSEAESSNPNHPDVVVHAVR